MGCAVRTSSLAMTLEIPPTRREQQGLAPATTQAELPLSVQAFPNSGSG
jgi:hypothetical protein